MIIIFFTVIFYTVLFAVLTGNTVNFIKKRTLIASLYFELNISVKFVVFVRFSRFRCVTFSPSLVDYVYFNFTTSAISIFTFSFGLYYVFRLMKFRQKKTDRYA